MSHLFLPTCFSTLFSGYVRRVSVVLLGCVSNLGLFSETSEPNEFSVAALLTAEIPRPKTFLYQRTERDPFLDASVKLTLLSQKSSATPPVEETGLNQFTQELSSELSQCHKITGVVCGERNGAVLIGRRILHTGDTLEVPLGEPLLKRIRSAEQNQFHGLSEVLGRGALALKVVWITSAGIGLTHSLLEEPLILPFLRSHSAISTAEPITIPK